MTLGDDMEVVEDIEGLEDLEKDLEDLEEDLDEDLEEDPEEDEQLGTDSEEEDSELSDSEVRRRLCCKAGALPL